MRITVHLDTFNCADPSVYAILWLDVDARKWSREGHAVIDLPEWGTLECSGSDTRIAAQHGGHPVCVLEGLNLSGLCGPFEGESGRALWHRYAHHAPVVGHWHVQCIDATATAPERGVFADDEI
ncbi:DUF3564 domain-containing protein [Paraburkholderia rhizosphaerae]|uniref:Uncharacterized protein DUF3564 n=1 Tax=Paraburkholderia rhizosphaerae TaxID=480658 RepID=A0A4R8LTC8_9BURK|nr:DUF3564 domain-containing protein [Paraburkholderia rhizosphaerae]TDY50960.1 uncharacterized protein DUF3564 [Paraburkholderia rhizosphaerae]